MDLAKVYSLIQLNDLRRAVVGGVGYLAEKPEDFQAQDDVVAALKTVKANLPAAFRVSGELAECMEKLGALLSEKPVSDALMLEARCGKFARVMGELIPAALCGQLSGTPHLDRQLSEELFDYIEQEAWDSTAMWNLILEVCQRSGLSNPRRAFETAIKLFERAPEILSGEGNAHPGYVYEPSRQRTFERCPICGGEGNPFYCAWSYKINTFEPPHLPVKLWMRCEACDNFYSWKYPEELLALSETQELLAPDEEKFWTTVSNGNVGVKLSIWAEVLERLSGYSEGTSLLEVGIGTGELLAVALELGYHVDAVEIMADSAQRVADMLGVPVWNGDFLRYAPQKTYSVIIMGDVIEHVISPGEALKNAYRLLDDDGVLWLSTPNYESSFSRLKKLNDPMWNEPYHITYFSYRGIAALAEKCGFTVMDYRVSNRYNGSMELVLVKTGEANP